MKINKDRNNFKKTKNCSCAARRTDNKGMGI